MQDVGFLMTRLIFVSFYLTLSLFDGSVGQKIIFIGSKISSYPLHLIIKSPNKDDKTKHTKKANLNILATRTYLKIRLFT